MKGKTKRFLSLLTAGALIITSVPSAFADETEMGSEKTATSITVNYSGGEKYVNSFIPSNEINITLNYSDGTSENLGETYTVENVTSGQKAPIISIAGWNEYTVTYTNEQKGINLSNSFRAWGYEEAGIDATYTGDSVLLGTAADSSQIGVKLMYTPHSDGSEFSETLSSSEYTLPDLTANTFGKNEFTVTSTKTAHGNTFTDTVDVYTHKREVTATYNGEPVKVGEKYNKSDVTVIDKTVYSKDNSSVDVQNTSFTVNSDVVTNEGANEFTATTDFGSATFNVTGYKEAPVVITGITAEYTGNDVRIDVEDKTQRYIPSNKVEITLHYSNNTTKVVGDNFTVSGVNNGTAPEVTTIGWNTFMATYSEGGQSWSDTFQAWGYKLDKIEAVYNGPDIRTQENYDKSNVSVTAYWTERKDGTSTSFTPATFDVNSLLVTQIGDNTFTATAEGKTDDFVVTGFDDRLYVDHIEAEYVGDDVLVGDNYSKDDIKVVYVYTNGTKSEPIEDFTVNSTEVTKNGNNEFTVSVDDETTKINVWGYSPESINAEYNGNNILVGNGYSKNDVSVTLTYSKGSDGINKKELLSNSVYTITDSSNEDSTTIKTTGNNTFTVTYNSLTDTFDVWGYTVDHIVAQYNGDDIRINEPYDKEDVTVTAYYSSRTDNGDTSFTVESKDFVVDSLIVTKEGANTFTATYKEKTANFTVNGFDDNVYVKSIEAEYIGPDILVGNDYSKNDIKLTIKYTDGTTRVVTDGFTVDSTTVTATGNNDFTVTLNNDTAKVKVWGYAPKAIEAEYVGPDVLVGNSFYSRDVEINLIYTPHSNGKVDKVKLPEDQYTITDKDLNPNPVVTTTGWNKFIVTYKDFSDDIQVWGYKPIAIDAEYTGSNVFVGNVIKASDITVNLVYSAFSNGNIKKDVIDVAACEVTPAVGNNGLKVSKIKDNTFTVTYNNLSDDIQVWGYEYDHMDAEYIGNDIRTDEDYNKSDVKVTVYYTQRTDNGNTSFVVSNTDDFEVNSTKVLIVGNNTYTATFNDLEDTFVVKGFDDRIYIDRIEAEYIGPDILVGNVFLSKDVKLTVYYTDGTSREIENGFTIEPFESGVGPVVEKKGWNDYTVTYKDMDAKIKVWGYEPKAIEAEYVGPDILVDNSFYSRDVKIKLIYTPFHDGTVLEEDLEEDQFTIVDDENRPRPIVKAVEWNKFTVTHNGLSDDIQVWGYKFDKLEAVYNGPSIYVNEKYDKKDVTVTAKYTPFHDKTIKTVDVKDFEVDSLVVTKVGSNTYDATCEYGKAPFTVPGIEKEIVSTENVFAITALDRNGKEVKGVKVEYSTNGHSGTLETGKTTSSKIGVGTVITDKDCKISLPDGYKLHTSTMGTSTSDTNTTYTLTIVVEKEEVKSEEPKQKANTIKLVAVDTEGKEVKDVVLSYDKDGYKGHLKSGATVEHSLGVNTVITENDYKIGVPEGYKFKDSKLTSQKNNDNTTYVITVTLTKAADTTPTKPNTTPSNSDTPQTGDESNTMLYMGIGGLALATMLGLLVTKKKEEDEDLEETEE